MWLGSFQDNSRYQARPHITPRFVSTKSELLLLAVCPSVRGVSEYSLRNLASDDFNNKPKVEIEFIS